MILKIFLKELKETLRDRRTLLTMLVIPTLAFPVILNVFIGITSSLEEKAANKEVVIGFVGDVDSPVISDLMHLPDDLGKHVIKPYASVKAMTEDVKMDSIQIAFIVPDEAVALEKGLKPIPVQVLFVATDVGIKDRAEGYMNFIEEKSVVERYKRLNLDVNELTPLEIQYVNLASAKEMIGILAGGILPYIFIAFGFLGCMYPAIDLFTGEKERGTMETLLTTPVARWQILFGKMGVVILSGLIAAVAALSGLFLSIEVLDIVNDPELLELINSILTPSLVFMLFLLLVPLIIFIAGIMMPLAISSKSFKEAQSKITPIQIVVILPAMMGLMPGLDLNAITAAIPVLNIVLSTKEMIAGTLDPWLLTESFAIMVMLAVGAVFFSYKRFDKETNIIM